MRWEHPDKGLSHPVFVPAAEDSRQVSPLSLWVLDRQLCPAPVLKFRR
ncbi:hypothetical protein EMIT0194P_230053 [Pseudomonas serbica]